MWLSNSFSSTLVLSGAILLLTGWALRYLTYVYAKKRYGCEEPPKYPHKDPFLGLDYWRDQKTAAKNSQWLATSKALFKRFGKTYEINNLGQRMIHTMEPENIQSVWATDFKNWGLQPLREGIAEPFFGHGINTTDGEFWKHSRALIRPTFARTELGNLDFLRKHTDRLIEQLPEDGSEVNLQPLFSRLFLDTSTEFLFGESMDSLLPNQAEHCASFIKAFDYCLFGLGARVRLGQLRFLHRDKKWLDAIKVVHKQVDKYIDRAIENEKKSKASPGTEESERYILINEMAKQTQDKLDLRSQILTVFMPGRDSTGHALSNVFHVLARKPDVYAKLREDVLKHGQSGLTFESLKSMRYLQWVINEGLRTHPTTAQSYRMALHETVLPTGGGKNGKLPIYIRKGDTVMASMWGMHQDEDIWGEDATEFRPERWDGLKPMWTFVPFLGGPRTCPAQQMVQIQEAYVLARFAQVYEKIENTEHNPWTEARRIGFQSKYGVKVKLTSVKNNTTPSTETFALDHAHFNIKLYTSILKLWLPTYPQPTSDFAQEDVLRWFLQSDKVDSQVREIALDTITSIGPSKFRLPAFKSYQHDRTIYDKIAAPFIPILNESSDLSAGERALALGILLDQFSRNLHRGDAQKIVYEHYDRISRAVVHAIYSKELDKAKCLQDTPVWRYWLYMPLEHSEDLADHELYRSVVGAILKEAREREDTMGAKFLDRAMDFEDKHYVPLKKFGRFPWRNKCLGRESSEEEKKWLEEGGDRFGTG